MSDTTRDFYIAHGPSLEITKAWFAASNEAVRLQQALMDEFGAQTVIRSGERMVGLVAPQRLDGLRKRTDADVGEHWVPNRRIKAGKILDRRFDEASGPSLMTLTRDLVGSAFAYMRGKHIWLICPERLDGDIVLHVPTGGPVPQDAELLKKSLYWTRKEAVAIPATQAVTP